MKSPLTRTKVQKIVSEIQQHHRNSGKPVSLNELPFWKPLTKSKKIKTGRGFKKMVMAGKVEGIKFVGVKKDNHSTYKPIDGGSRFMGFFSKFLR